MEYRYRIYNEIYNDMISGKKTIEFRLLNEKSESIKRGDTIKFIAVDNDKKFLITEVIDKYIYDNLDELWNSRDILNNALNYSKEELIKAFNNIFGKEQVSNSKIVGFKIKVINQ